MTGTSTTVQIQFGIFAIHLIWHECDEILNGHPYDILEMKHATVSRGIQNCHTPQNNWVRPRHIYPETVTLMTDPEENTSIFIHVEGILRLLLALPLGMSYNTIPRETNTYQHMADLQNLKREQQREKHKRQIN